MPNQVRLLPPEPWSSTKVYSGRGGRHGYAIKCPGLTKRLRAQSRVKLDLWQNCHKITERSSKIVLPGAPDVLVFRLVRRGTLHFVLNGDSSLDPLISRLSRSVNQNLVREQSLLVDLSSSPT
jgi:hypothetical protein